MSEIKSKKKKGDLQINLSFEEQSKSIIKTLEREDKIN